MFMYKKIVFILILLFVSMNNVYANNLYEIELIVIKNKPMFSDKIDANSYLGKGNFVALPDSKYKLFNVVNAINKSKDYKVLYHTAWEQALEHRKYGKSFHVINDQALDYKIKGDLAIMPNKNLFNTEIHFVMQKEGEYTEPVKLITSGRLKENELYYFDHAKFGLFIIIQPSKLEKIID